MSLLSFALGPIIGAVIGAGTNKLAIHMLFHPYEAKYIGKFQLPFTPGIIPKEQKRIALAVGRMVSDELLNEAVLRRTLLDEDMVEKVQSLIDKYLLQLQKNDTPLGDILSPYIDEQQELQLLDDLCCMVSEKICAPAVVEELSQLAVRKINEPQVLDSITQLVLQRINSPKVLDDLCQLVSNKINNSSLADDLTRMVCQKLCDPSISELAADKVVEELMHRFPLMVTIFRSGVREMVKSTVGKFLSDNETTLKVHQLVTQLIGEMPEKVRGMLSQFLEEAPVLVREQVGKLLSDAPKVMNSLIGNLLAEVPDMVNAFILKEADKLKARPLSQLLEGKEVLFSKISAALSNAYCNVIETKLPTLLSELNIAKIIEDQINSFDMAEAERLIYEITDKELKSLVWLGGLLGAILGIFTYFLRFIP